MRPFQAGLRVLGWGASAASVLALSGFVRRAAMHDPLRPPVRLLGATIATSTEAFGGIGGVHVLSDGRVVVNDIVGRRVVVLDRALTNARVTLDTTPATKRGYSGAIGTLFAFRGDSSLLQLFGRGITLSVLDSGGAVARTIQVSNAAERVLGLGNARGFTDAAGRLVFQETPPAYLTLVPPDFVGETIVHGPDSTALLRFDPASGRVDTAAVLRARRVRQAITTTGAVGAGGRRSGRAARDPVPFGGDDWAVLPDGTIAIVRITDYHVDWLHADGSVTSSAKVPHTWEHLTDSMKVALVDSIKRIDGVPLSDSAFATARAAADSMALVMAANPDAFPGRGRAGGPAGAPPGVLAGIAMGPPVVRPQYVAASDLPDSRPPFASGEAIADAEGDLWVHAVQAVGEPRLAGDVFEIIDRKGTMIDRVQLPAGTKVLAFGPGVVYLQGPFLAGPIRPGSALPGSPPGIRGVRLIEARIR